MLCDDIARLGVRNPLFEPDRMARVIARIGAAVKFDLTQDFAQVADELAVDLHQIVKALPFCRLPYPEIWIEVAHQHRLNFVEGSPPGPLQGTPHRIGFLLTATSDRLSAFTAHMFWSMAENSRVDPGLTNAAAFATRFDLENGIAGREDRYEVADPNNKIARSWNSLSPDQRVALSRVVTPTLPDYGIRVPAGLSELELVEYIDRLNEFARKDWGGETNFIESVLALLNTRNASEATFIDNAAMNHKRARAGRHELASHHVLRIHTRVRSRMKAMREAERNAELRQHFVRGHWKVRATGVFFWHPFVRGRAGAGVVTKDYQVAS